MPLTVVLMHVSWNPSRHQPRGTGLATLLVGLVPFDLATCAVPGHAAAPTVGKQAAHVGEPLVAVAAHLVPHSPTHC